MSNPAGSWNLVVSTPFGDQQLTLVLEVDGTDVSGTATHPSGTFSFTGGRYDDDQVTFTMSLTTPVTADLKVKARATGDELTGTARSGVLSFKLRGTRA